MFRRRKKDDDNGAPPLPTPEEDLSIAQQALARGDLKHAAFHVGGALATNPDNQDGLTLLDQIIALAGSKALDLAPLSKEGYYGTAAVRAYILAAQAELSSAVQLLLSVIVAHPEIPYAHWLLRWRDQTGFAPALTPELAIGAAGPILGAFQQQDYVPVDAAKPLANLETVLALATEVHPEASLVWFLRSVALRKRGLFEEAARVAEEGHRRAPSYGTAVAMAGVYRRMRNFDAAVAAFREAISRQPNEEAGISARNDIADILCGQGKVEEGVREYRAVLDYAPDDAWALPSYLYFMHDLQPDEGWDAKLADLATRARDNQRAQQLMGRLAIVRRGYFDLLPEADEASINVARQLTAEPKNIAKGGKIEIGLSHLESPSARLAITMELAARLPGVTLEFGVADVPTPDPRLPRKPFPYVLWTYDGMTPRPAVPAPNPAVVSAITHIARTPFNIEAWREPARRLSQELGPQALDDLLAVMVHPSAPPDARPAWDWIRQLQIASALTIAQLGDSAWEGSLRRDALLSLVYGPMDWAGVAALVALASLATHEPALAPSVEEIYLDLLSQPPSEGAWALYNPLVVLLNRLPYLSERGRVVAKQERGSLLDAD
jgi:tetratricopeptide (TPR) repeat protein